MQLRLSAVSMLSGKGHKNVICISMVWMPERYLTENEFKRCIKD